MRFLFLIIFSFFFFVSLESRASANIYEQVKQENKNRNYESQVIVFITDHQSAAIAYSPQTSSFTSRSTVFPYANFVNIAYFLSNPKLLYETRYAISRDLYCKKIGLKLIFPEHYFW